MTPFLDAFSYPLRGNGWIQILTGALVVMGLSWFQGIPRLGWVILLFIGGYFGAHFIEVIHSTIQGGEEPPDWPTVANFADDIVAPLARLLGLALISFGPLMAVRFFGTAADAWFWPAAVVAGLWGAAYFPMSLIAVAVSDQLAAASPHIVLPAIGRSLPAYLLNVFFLGAVWIGLVGAEWAASQIPAVGSLLAGLTGLYGLIFLARCIGLTYRHQRHRLGWEGERQV